MSNLYLDIVVLLYHLLNGKTGDIAKTDFIKSKPLLDKEYEDPMPLARSTPEKEGVPSGFIQKMLSDLYRNPSIRMHHFLVIRHNKVISETSFHPYRRGDWHISYSLCKSFVGMAIGILMDEGKLKLNEKVMDIFGLSGGLWNSFKLRDLTVEQLLIMASGAGFNEAGALTCNNWTRSFLDSSLKFSPGKEYSYNSMNTYILSAIVSKITGKRLDDFLNEKLFRKMGIHQYHWETSPEGITKGGWGLFIRPEDAAKLGLLYLNKGVWNGERLLSESFVNRATSKQIENGYYGYGYQLWMGKRKGSYNFDGMLGQNVRVFPDLDMILVNNAGDCEILFGGAMDEIINQYMEDPPVVDGPLADDKSSHTSLLHLIHQIESGKVERSREYKGGWNLKRKENFGEKTLFLKELSGKRFAFKDRSLGIFPLVLQMFHNNFTDGISELCFLHKSGKNYIIFSEGEHKHKIELNLREVFYHTLNIKGEPYEAATKTELALNEDGNQVLTIRIHFLEEVAVRVIKLCFLRDEISILFSESPGKEMVESGLELSFEDQLNDVNFLVKKALEAIPENLIKSLVQHKVHSTTKAKRIKENQ